MKKMIKKIVYGSAVALGAVVVGLITPIAKGMGELYTDVFKFGMKHSRSVVIGIGLAGALTYVGCQHKEKVWELAVQGSSTPFVVQYHRENNALEKELDTRDKQQSALEQLLQEQQANITQLQHEKKGLEDRIARKETRVTTPPTYKQPSTSPFVHYYTKPGDTLAGIADKVSGNSRNYTLIAKDNNITNPQELIAGQLLRLRKTLCSRYNADVYKHVPDLPHIVLKGKTLQETFENWQDVQAFNETLGLTYGNTFRGKKRVVYYQNGIHNLKNPF